MLCQGRPAACAHRAMPSVTTAIAAPTRRCAARARRLARFLPEAGRAAHDARAGWLAAESHADQAMSEQVEAEDLGRQQREGNTQTREVQIACPMAASCGQPFHAPLETSQQAGRH
jgi:hypothetical protein